MQEIHRRPSTVFVILMHICLRLMNTSQTATRMHLPFVNLLKTRSALKESKLLYERPYPDFFLNVMKFTERKFILHTLMNVFFHRYHLLVQCKVHSYLGQLLKSCTFLSFIVAMIIEFVKCFSPCRF